MTPIVALWAFPYVWVPLVVAAALILGILMIAGSRARTWDDVRPHLAAELEHPEHLRGLIRAGIPATLRPTVWATLSGATAAREAAGERRYEQLRERTSPFDDQIRLDIGRTFPTSPLFSTELGQEKLFNVLRACANAFPDIGYGQNMSFMAAMALLHCKDEQDAFWLMHQLIKRDKYNIACDAKVERFELASFQYDKLLRAARPKLQRHLAANDIFPSNVTDNSFLTIFARNVGDEALRLRIWDIYISEGTPALFQFVLAFLDTHAEKLLAADGFEQVFLALQASWEGAPDQIVRRAMAFKVTPEKLAALAIGYAATAPSGVAG